MSTVPSSGLGCISTPEKEFFLVELLHLRQFAQRAHQVGLAVEVARFYAEFAANNMLVQARIALDGDIVDGGLLALVDAHFVVDAVAFDVYLHGVEVEEEVAIVLIEFRHRVVVFVQAFVQLFQVVHIAPIDVQHTAQVVARIDRIARPSDVAEVVFFAFVDSEIDIDMIFVVFTTLS